MSRVLPNAVVGRAFYRLGVGNPTLQADLPPMVNAGLQKLYGFQHNDGGWGWWFDDSTHDYQTAWVVFGLSMTRDAGYEVDPAVIQRGAKWLQAHLNNMDERTCAYALYTLSIAGYGDLTSTQKLAAEPIKLDAFSQAALALALHELGDKAGAQQMLDVLAKTAVIEDGQVSWPNPHEDGHYYEKTMASTTRSTALALSAFAHIAPQHELEPGIVRWLMNQRRPQGWGSTNETSFAILALTDHLLATEELAATNTGYQVELNGQVIASGILGQRDPAMSLDIPAREMVSGKNQLRITQTGSGRLYYAIHHRAYLPQPEIAAAGNITVSREYLDPRTGLRIEKVKPGQLVKVQLKVTLPDNGFYMIVQDNLPGGLEALNEKLNTSSHEGVADEEPHYYWQEYGYNNKEVYGDRVSFFITEMSKGVSTFSYLARATHSGEFVSLPAEASAMYDLTRWGRSASARFTVNK
jgi:uncharacterized protein YfaS (alpha-2-macroglobulin family)